VKRWNDQCETRAIMCTDNAQRARLCKTTNAKRERLCETTNAKQERYIIRLTQANAHVSNVKNNKCHANWLTWLEANSKHLHARAHSVYTGNCRRQHKNLDGKWRACYWLRAHPLFHPDTYQEWDTRLANCTLRFHARFIARGSTILFCRITRSLTRSRNLSELSIGKSCIESSFCWTSHMTFL